MPEAKQRPRFGYTLPAPRLDPDFDSWMEEWRPRSVQERQRMRPCQE